MLFKNLFHVTIRNLRKYRFYTFINVFGLTTGVVACLVIFLYIRFELSFDMFHEHAERIYRVDWHLQFGENSTHRAAVTPPMAEVLRRDFPEVEAATRFRYNGSAQYRRDDENVVEWRMVYADNDLFNIFSFRFLEGDGERALTDPNTMVITRKCAEQFFPGESALGKTLLQNNTTLYKITGVVEDLPENSHFHYRMFLSMEGLPESKNGNWIGGPYNTYILLREGADPNALEKKLPVMVNNYLVPYSASVLGSAFMDDFSRGGNYLELRLMPLGDIHLHSHLQNELAANSDMDYVILLGAIAGFILILACINFMNLSTARSVKRAREVGIRKVLGSGRLKVAIQFVTESTLLSLVACILAVVLLQALLPMFNAMTGLDLVMPFGDPLFYVMVLCTALLVGILSGTYPGMIMASYQPARVLKGAANPGRNSAALRSGLVVFQFAVSITLMIATLAVYEQLEYIRHRNLGFAKENVLLLHDLNNAKDKLPSFRDEMLKMPFIHSATISSFFPGPGSARQSPLFWKYGATPTPENSLNMERWLVDDSYIPTLGITLVAGRNFSKENSADSTAVILNETAVKLLGFASDDVLGQRIAMFHENDDGSQDRSKVEYSTVTGVVRDFNFESLREKVYPLALFYGRSSSFMAFRYETDDSQKVIASLKETWKRVAPGEPFHYSFLDSKFTQFYAADDKLGNLFIVFSGLAIVIACLGLFALTAFTAEQKAKEIGIRKVFGASVKDVVLLLSTNFSKLVLIGFVVALPAAMLIVSWYLGQYAYKASIGVWVFAIAGGAAFLLAVLTMAWQSIQAALMNPVDSISSE